MEIANANDVARMTMGLPKGEAVEDPRTKKRMT
jgi:hypothetical protein